jgi:hypothetical protein
VCRHGRPGRGHWACSAHRALTEPRGSPAKPPSPLLPTISTVASLLTSSSTLREPGPSSPGERGQALPCHDRLDVGAHVETGDEGRSTEHRLGLRGSVYTYNDPAMRCLRLLPWAGAWKGAATGSWSLGLVTLLGQTRGDGELGLWPVCVAASPPGLTAVLGSALVGFANLLTKYGESP